MKLQCMSNELVSEMFQWLAATLGAKESITFVLPMRTQLKTALNGVVSCLGGFPPAMNTSACKSAPIKKYILPGTSKTGSAQSMFL